MAAEWYFKVTGTKFGPLSTEELVQHAAEGRILPDTEVRKGDGAWSPASRVRSLFDRAEGRGVAAPATEPSPPTAAEDRPPPLPAARRIPSLPLDNGEAPPSTPAGDKVIVLDSAESAGFRVEVLAYTGLDGARDSSTASAIYFATAAGMQLKQVRITLRDAEAVAEASALHYVHGRIDIENKVGGLGGLGKAVVNKFISKEAAFLPRYRGTGQVHLEPSFGHFLIYRLGDEEIIADKGMFVCGQGSIDVGAALQKSVSSALFGGEGFFQTRVRGPGVCVFELPVPLHEVRRVDLKDETLRVDGNFALMRTGRIEFTVEKSTKGLIGTLTSGELLLQTFRGTGTVWLAPTQAVYRRLAEVGLAGMASSSRTSGT